MNHIINIYKGEEHITRKEFFSFAEAMAYLEECDKLSDNWSVYYQRKTQQGS